MRAVAITVWVFINLGFFGMCGYIYLMFSQYWYRAARQIKYEIVQKKRTYNLDSQVIFYEPEEPIKASTENRARLHNKAVPCDPHSRGCDMKLPKDIRLYKNDLYVQLRRVLHDESSAFKTDNPYNVNYVGIRDSYLGKSVTELSCLMKETALRVLTKNDKPFDTLTIGKLLADTQNVFSKNYDSCAVVSNAGSLLNSQLGQIIDNHDLVVRFNHAPTKGYEEDVGSKTHVRIVNSQVVARESFNFSSDILYKNVTVVVWDPSDYGEDLVHWYNKPDFDFMDSWTKYKTSNNGSNSFIIDPRSVWRLWDLIQSLMNQRIRRNPPSSGFLGISLMMKYCKYVDVFEYVPSVRQTKRCHYFDELVDSSCTFGVWHPLAAEKLLTLALNMAEEIDVFQTGFVRLQGYQNLHC